MQSRGYTKRSRADLGGYSCGTTQAPLVRKTSQGWALSSDRSRFASAAVQLADPYAEASGGQTKVQMEEAEDSTLWNAALEQLFMKLLMEDLNTRRIIKQVKGKWNRMKRNHIDFAFVLKQTGFEWRLEADTIEWTDEAWANLMRVERSSSSRAYQREPPIYQCIPWLSSLDPPLLEDQYENTVDCLLKDNDLQNALMAMLVRRRMRYSPYKDFIVKVGQAFKGEVLAAYLAFAMGMNFTGREVIFEGDSLVLLNQVLNEDCHPDWLIESEVETIRQFLKEQPSWKLQWTPHEWNEMAHRLAY
ncbi:hypothetical protein CJ030_MR6G027716 [Morella rubra]|uniref:RNase H type-1 domain-containing protein n=1 Tax=Morella rubra TaxID=262757 RepID=A0A6A1VC88_9ROSI|nr:hypothetical protein CJ030_MR6G027716 [Morella rubra]